MICISDGDWRSRINKCCGVLAWCNCLQLIFALTDSREWPEWCILLVLLLVMIQAGAGGLLMAFLWSSSKDFRGMEVYINLGTSISGIVAALLSILAKVFAIQL